EGMRAAGVVGDYAADRRARTGRHVGAETESVRPEKLVELIEHHAGADAHGALLEIEFGDRLVMPAEIDDEPFADRAADEPGAGAAGNDRDAAFTGRLDDGTDLLRVTRERNGRRFDLVMRSVGGVKLPRDIVESYFAIRRRERRNLLRRSHRALSPYRRCEGMTIPKGGFASRKGREGRKGPGTRDSVLDCGSPLPLERAGTLESGRGLPQSRTLSRLQC